MDSVDLYGRQIERQADRKKETETETETGRTLLADALPQPASLLPKATAEADATAVDKSAKAKVVSPEENKDTEPGLLSKIAANTWLQINGASYHFDRDRGFNERNYGLGLMYRISEDKAVAVGEYKNSINKTSHYAYLDYEPLKMGPVRAGVLAGTVDGYYFRNGGFIPMLAPTASIEGKHFGLSAFYIPPMKNISSVVALQARVKFW